MCGLLVLGMLICVQGGCVTNTYTGNFPAGNSQTANPVTSLGDPSHVVREVVLGIYMGCPN